MTRNRFALAGICLFAFVACGTTASTSSSYSSPSPTPTPTPQPLPTYSVVYAVNFDGSAPQNTVLHEATITAGKATDRVVASSQQLNLLDARAGLALVSLIGSGQGAGGADTQTLATIDLKTGAVHKLEAARPDLGISGVLSPDGTQAAVDMGGSQPDHTIDIVTLSSGASRQLSLANTPGPITYPVRWTANELVVATSGDESAPTGLYSTNTQSGALKPISTESFETLSPMVKFQAMSMHSNLGDNVDCECQDDWQNTLSTSAVDGKYKVIESEKNREFDALDVGDDGSVLYAEDGGSSGPAADGGLYYYTDLQTNLQFPDPPSGDWTSGGLLSSQWAVAAHVSPVYSSSSQQTLEFDLVGLCASATGCKPSMTPISTTSGASPGITVAVIHS